MVEQYTETRGLREMALVNEKNEVDWKLLDHVFSVTYDYIDKIIYAVKEKLKKQGVENIDVYPRVDVVENRVEIKIQFEIDVTEILGNQIECLYLDGVAESCSERVADLVAQGEIDEEQAEKVHDECVQNEIDQFIDEYGGQPFYFAYSNTPNIIAYLKTEIYESSHDICVHDILHVVWRQEIFVDVVDTLESENVINNNVSMIVGEIERIVGALKILAGVK